MPPETKPVEPPSNSGSSGDKAFSSSTTLPRHIMTNASANDDEIIKLPVLKYGYCQKPLQWHELEQIVITTGELERLSRSEAKQREYEIFKRYSKSQWKSTYDYLLVEKFGVEKKESNGLWSAGSRSTADRKSILVPNDFPYSMEHNIEHWILWKLESSCSEEDIENAKEELRQKRKGQEVEFLHWLNPLHLRSLPDIDHIHILMRCK